MPRARGWTAAADLFLIVVICAQVALVGAAVVAYGARHLLRSAAPYAPLELASFCLASGVYLAVRLGQPPRRRLVLAGAGAIVSLLRRRPRGLVWRGRVRDDAFTPPTLPELIDETGRPCARLRPAARPARRADGPRLERRVAI